MKKNIFFCTLLAGLFMASSCGEDFLALAPEDQLTIDGFYKTYDQFKVAVNGAYAAIQPMYSGAGAAMYLYGELRSDNTTFQGNQNQSQSNRKAMDWFLEGRNTGDGFFQNLYSAIARTNVILDLVDGSALPDVQKAQIKGEASFLRAFFYFQLVRLWGEVPLVLKQVKSFDEAFEVSATRASISAIYDQIIADATTAANNLPATYAAVERGRATKYAAKTLMADAYLTQGKYAEALTQLTGTGGVITDNVHSLRPTYAGLWGTGNEYNTESIWEINYFQTDVYANQNSSFQDTFGPNNANFQIGNNGAPVTTGGVVNTDLVGTGWGIATTDLLNSFESGDARKNMINSSFMSSGMPIPYTTKFWSAHTVTNRYGNNWPVYRYAEVLLMAAECLNKQASPDDAQARTYLNMVRTRAGLAADNTATGTALFDIIFHERRVELAHENKRWFDLLRTGTAVSVMVAAGDALRADANNPNAPDDPTPSGAYDAANILTKLIYPDREVQVLGFTPPVE